MDDYYGFVLHYLDSRPKKYGIDDSVRGIMGAHDLNITKMEIDGFLIEDTEKYILSLKGKEIADGYFAEYKAKNKKMLADVAEAIRAGNYEESFYIHAKRYCENVVPPGIGTNWSDMNYVRESARKELEHLRKINFDDLNNSDEFKEYLFKNAVYDAKATSIFDDLFPMEEKINCPDLELFLQKRNAVISENNKRYIYLFTKISRNNLISVNKTLHRNTSTNFNDGWNVSDGWVKIAHDAYEFTKLSEMNIPKFPKTFNTYTKHKEKNSEKYQSWMDYVKAKT
jgi:hypothetical protein